MSKERMQWSVEKEATSYFRGRGVPIMHNRGKCRFKPDEHGRTKLKKNGCCAVCEMQREHGMRRYRHDNNLPFARDVKARRFVVEQIRRRKAKKAAASRIPPDLRDLLS